MPDGSTGYHHWVVEKPLYQRVEMWVSSDAAASVAMMINRYK